MSALFSASSRLFLASWPGSSSCAKPVRFEKLSESDFANEIGVWHGSHSFAKQVPVKKTPGTDLQTNANQSRSVGFGTRGEELVVGFVFGKLLASLGDLAWFVCVCKTSSL